MISNKQSYILGGVISLIAFIWVILAREGLSYWLWWAPIFFILFVISQILLLKELRIERLKDSGGTK